MSITQERLKELLSYDPETGVLKWLTRPKSSRRACGTAGSVRPDGYIHVMLDKKLYLAHRLAFLYMDGEFPAVVADHVNGVKSDNRWSNLRSVTVRQNRMNATVNKSSKSGVKGVYWDKGDKKWIARLYVNGKKIVVGYFPDLIGAELAVRKARIELHGEFANHGRN